MSSIALFLTVTILVMTLGGAAVVFGGSFGNRTQKRVSEIAKASGVSAAVGKGAAQDATNRRKNIQALLKELEKNQKKNKERPSLRRRLEQAGLDGVSPQKFWMISGGVAVVTFIIALISGQSLLVIVLGAFGAGLGLPRWALAFLKARREKAFTKEFANAIDTIIRSVKTGLPTNEALKIVARESPDPVGEEFNLLCESLKVGVTMEQALTKMSQNMPTPEVNFFAIVMVIQQKSGGNLSEALTNLSSVLRDRKRLRDKIKAMSSEAKASAMIIGSLPPGVMLIVYLTTPDYMSLLFTTYTGNLMLAAGGFWMSMGIFVMRQMINFKH